MATSIGHSLSPAMHNMSLRKLRLNYAYMAFEVGNEELADAVQGMRALGARGFNVSMPNKTKVLPLLDELSPAAQFAGAVNKVVNENGKLIGHITDGTGYMRGLKEAGVDVVGKKWYLWVLAELQQQSLSSTVKTIATTARIEKCRHHQQ